MFHSPFSWKREREKHRHVKHGVLCETAGEDTHSPYVTSALITSDDHIFLLMCLRECIGHFIPPCFFLFGMLTSKHIMHECHKKAFHKERTFEGKRWSLATNTPTLIPNPADLTVSVGGGTTTSVFLISDIQFLWRRKEAGNKLKQ